MAKNKRPPVPVHTYYVYDPGVRDELGGARVRSEEGTVERIVVLTQSQASYWMNAGVIGTVPLAVLEGGERLRVHQALGGRIPLVHGGKATTPRRNSTQDPNTMAIGTGSTAAGIVAGMNPVTGGVSDPTISKKQRAMSQRMSRPMYTSHEGLKPNEVKGL